MSKAKKQATTVSRSAVGRFLRALGIKRSTAAKVFTSAFWREVKKAGGDPQAAGDARGFGPKAQHAYFVTEEIARRTLSVDFDRLSEHMRDFQGLNGFPSPPVRVS